MSNTLVSVVIPCYNHGKYLEETLQSIEKSTDKYPVEVIVVNDGSTDENTLEVFKRIEDKGFFVLHQANQGLGKARNNGIKLAKGKYILPLDSDNNVCKPYLNEAIEILEKNKSVSIVYGDAIYIGEKSGIWKNHPLDKNKILLSNHIDACAVFRKDVWTLVGGYAEDMPYMGSEDWNFWLKCINLNQDFYYLDTNCFEYRVLSGSMIRSVPNDYHEKIFAFCMSNFPKMYGNELRMYYNKNYNVFHGNIIKKVIKLVLNHFKMYKY